MRAAGLRRIALTWLVLLPCFGGCASLDVARYSTLVRGPLLIADGWRGLPVADGQIIVTEKPSAMALLLSLAVERFEPFVHAGLVVFDDGRPQVYEAFGSLRPHFGGRPTRGMGGGVRRVPLQTFLARGGITAIYEPAAGMDRAGLARFARAALRDRLRFDDVFDSRDERRVYCVEFVARALASASGERFTGVPLSRNASMRRLLDWFEISAPHLLLAGQLVDEDRRVLLLDPERSPRRIAGYFARKRELHRRFSADQRLGNVFEWTGAALRLRPPVRAYLFAADEVTGATQLADRLLGPAAEPEFARARP
jgi:hypothetical protein